MAGGLPEGLSAISITPDAPLFVACPVSASDVAGGSASTEPCSCPASGPGSMRGSNSGCRLKVQWVKLLPSSLQKVMCVVWMHMVIGTSVLP